MRLTALAGALALATVVGTVALVRHHHRADDPRVDHAFVLAQRGEDDRALQILADYLGEHGEDVDARLTALLATWWQGTPIDEPKARATTLPLRPAQRAMVEGIDLMTQRRNAEAIAYMENAAHDMPDAVEVVYVLGEAQWHGQHLEDGATTLARAFAIDPRWEMALHHVDEYRLSRGETTQLAPISTRLHASDPAAAAVLDCEIAISDRDYARAVTSARDSLGRADLDKIPELYVCLAQAQALAGDSDGGAATAKTAFQLWPLESRDRGGFAQYAEFALYRHDLDGYLDLVRGKPSSQRAIALLYWRPTAPVDEPQPAWPARRMSPIGAATWVLQQHVHGVDASGVYANYPEPEVRAWGTALADETRGDRAGAIAELRAGLALPQKGDMRMLLAHRLALLLHQAGDDSGTAAACDEVIRPRLYMNYRAVLLPDCIAWTRPR
jgi:hypothetical protein